jgi:hypothetical protein
VARTIFVRAGSPPLILGRTKVLLLFLKEAFPLLPWRESLDHVGRADRLREITQQQNLPIEGRIRASRIGLRDGARRVRFRIVFDPGGLAWAVCCAHADYNAWATVTAVWRNYVRLLR